MMSGYVLVGLGSGEPGRYALEWGAHEAASRHAALRIVRAYHLNNSLAPWQSSADRMITNEVRHRAQDRLLRASRYVAELDPELEVHTEAVDGITFEVLLKQARGASVTVVGSRRLGVVGSAVLGSVSTVVAGDAPGPVVVVSAPPGLPEERPAVVVGIDGGDRTKDLLAFAFDYASRHDRTLRMVYCWRRDPAANVTWRPPAPEKAYRWLAEVTAGWSDGYPDVEVQRFVVRDHPVEGLVRASYSQELLVVGARGHHARVAALLGSVSQGVLHHATCPVAVVH
jgi:nucleotide-binding universal stress UspA family protein